MAEKVEAIKMWGAPNDQTQEFLEMKRLYLFFVQNFAIISQALTIFLGKGKKWAWGTIHEILFQNLKDSLIHAPTLKVYDMKRPIKIIIDASRLEVGGMLLHEWEDEWYPIA